MPKKNPKVESVCSVVKSLNQASSYLASRGITHPRQDAEDLLSSVLGLSRSSLYLDGAIDNETYNLYFEKVIRRGHGEPLQYIIGSTFFYGAFLELTPDVLIPRPETELLVERVVNTLIDEEVKGKILWDMCTGSGCIAIALKKRFPQLIVMASDRCHAALEVAKKNAKINGVEIAFFEGDLFAPFEGKKCDYFVCNPPYVAQGELKNLDSEVKDFEPHIALHGGISGLDFYKRIAKELQKFLSPLGRAWLEIGSGQGKKITSLFAQEGFKKMQIGKDYAGLHRFFSLERDRIIG
jgi:release factor glutamine methyltransferase